MGLKDSLAQWFIRRELDNQAKEGTMFGKIWAYLNGKKTVIGAILTIIGMIGDQLAVLLPVLLSPAEAVQYIGIATTVIGGLHKLYKFVYKEEHA
jgi:hypothetical protein